MPRSTRPFFPALLCSGLNTAGWTHSTKERRYLDLSLRYTMSFCGWCLSSCTKGRPSEPGRASSCSCEDELWAVWAMWARKGKVWQLSILVYFLALTKFIFRCFYTRLYSYGIYVDWESLSIASLYLIEFRNVFEMFFAWHEWAGYERRVFCHFELCRLCEDASKAIVWIRKWVLEVGLGWMLVCEVLLWQMLLGRTHALHCIHLALRRVVVCAYIFFVSSCIPHALYCAKSYYYRESIMLDHALALDIFSTQWVRLDPSYSWNGVLLTCCLPSSEATVT